MESAGAHVELRLSRPALHMNAIPDRNPFTSRPMANASVTRAVVRTRGSGATAAALVLLLGMPAVASGQRASGGCAATAARRDTLTLPDGALPYVAVSSAARSRGLWFLAGTPTLRWPAQANQDSRPATDSAVGVLLSGTGASSLVTTPVAGTHVLFPRVVPEERGGWHAVFVTSRFADGRAPAGDSATLWYGFFDGARWQKVAAVGSLMHARHRPEFASQLVMNGAGELGFAYPLSPDNAERGVVLVHGRPERWKFDTLRTSLLIDYASLLDDAASRSWTIVIRLFDYRSASTDGGSLYVARFDSRWHRPRLVVRAATRTLNEPRLVKLSSATYVTWSQSPEADDTWKVGAIRWARVRPERPIDALRATVVAHGTNQYHVLRLGSDAALWVMRDFQDAGKVRLALASGPSVQELSSIEVANDAAFFAIPRDRHSVFFLSARLGRRADEVPVVMIGTTVSLTCRQSP